jgi:hypothetical protein
MDWNPTVFVAMSFDAQYQSRFSNVFEPAIRALSINGTTLSPIRVDLSASGDSIISQINDGIAHSLLVLADVSVVGHDAVTKNPYRNGNVLYEVGIALSCRCSDDVLLVRDDHAPFLFDVSTIPHANVNFSDAAAATEHVRTLLNSRLEEQRFTQDVRVERALACLSVEEIYVLRGMLDRPLDFLFIVKSNSVLRQTSGIQRLLDQGILRYAGSTPNSDPAYTLTSLGKVVAERVR